MFNQEDNTVNIGNYSGSEWVVSYAGVKLGEYTVVGSNSVVTKSFDEGYCVIAGNPARIIRKIDREKCKLWTSEFDGHGYISKQRFVEYRKKKLNV